MAWHHSRIELKTTQASGERAGARRLCNGRLGGRAGGLGHKMSRPGRPGGWAMCAACGRRDAAAAPAAAGVGRPDG